MKWISDLIDLIFPRHCVVCGQTLSPGEQHICLNCLYTLPRVEPRLFTEIESIFWGKVDIERAASFMYYRKGERYNNILHHTKYRNRPEVGRHIASIAASELKEQGFFDGIDIIVPLPLSDKKRRERGYNQCDYIAEGLSLATGIPTVKNIVKRDKDNATQTHKSREERWENVKGIFSVALPHELDGKHILLVDDILTTGATLASCTSAIKESTGCTVSIFTIGYTNNSL